LQTFRANANPIAYTVSATIQLGEGGQAGLYSVYKNAANHVEASIDMQQGMFVTSATVGGQNPAQRSFPFPAGFDISAPHDIQVTRSADGQFAFYFDGAFVDQRAIAPGFGQAGLFATVPGAHFRNFFVTDISSGWGDAYGDVAEGLPREAAADSSVGYVRGDWTISDGATVESSSAGTGWNTVYQGSPNFIDYTVQVDAKLAGPGSATLPPAYGLIVCHDDRSNQLTLWIDPAQNALTWNAIVQGRSTSQSVVLPPGLDPAQIHQLAAAKAGTLFTFFLDGNQMAQGTYALANGTSGLVTRNARVQYQRYSVAHP